jgi:hypothetical protein
VPTPDGQSTQQTAVTIGQDAWPGDIRCDGEATTLDKADDFAVGISRGHKFFSIQPYADESRRYKFFFPFFYSALLPTALPFFPLFCSLHPLGI